MSPRTNGFSLVELSIVLVILGLLVGGVLSGQSLVRAAELRSVTVDYNKYQTALRSFKDKYFAIPGDMTNATSFWGSAGGTGADINCAATAPPTSTATCNGNGDGTLYDYQAFGGLTSQETFRFWDHLSYAGLIEGKYNAYSYTGGIPAIGTVVPGSRIGTNVYFLARNTYGTTGYYTGSPSEFAGDYGKNMFLLTTGSNGNTTGAMALKPEDAWNIDSKMDDGIPGSGIIWAYKGTGGTKTNCTDKANVFPPGDAGAVYLLSNSNKDCQLYFIKAF